MLCHRIAQLDDFLLRFLFKETMLYYRIAHPVADVTLKVVPELPLMDDTPVKKLVIISAATATNM